MLASAGKPLIDRCSTGAPGACCGFGGKGGRVWDVRFERAVVETLLAAWASSPRGVGRLLLEHRRRLEVVAPRTKREKKTGDSRSESCTPAPQVRVPQAIGPEPLPY
jgi:hypothetical protein